MYAVHTSASCGQDLLVSFAGQASCRPAQKMSPVSISLKILLKSVTIYFMASKDTTNTNKLVHSQYTLGGDIAAVIVFFLNTLNVMPHFDSYM